MPEEDLLTTSAEEAHDAVPQVLARTEEAVASVGKVGWPQPVQTAVVSRTLSATGHSKLEEAERPYQQSCRSVNARCHPEMHRCAWRS